MASHREFQVFAMIQRLVELDADAVDAYAVAVERARDAGWRPSLIHFQDDHERHLLELRGFLDARDAEFSPTFGVRRTLKQGRVVLASVLGDRSLLRVLRSQEQNLSEDYGLAVSQPSLPPELAAILNAGFADEQQHLDWLDRRSAKLGQPGD